VTEQGRLMTRRFCSGLAFRLFGVAALYTTPSFADVAPPAGFVETCTVEQQQGPNRECVLCGDSYYKEPDACAHKLETAGYTKSCKTRGASTWKEVWCRKPAAASGSAPATTATVAEPAASVVAADPPKAPSSQEPAALPENAPRRGCGACVVGATDPAAGVASFALLLGLVAMARARRAH